MLEYLVDQQYFSAPALKFIGEVDNAVTGELEVVHVNEQARTVCSEFLFCVLEKESGLSYATGSLDTNQAIVPINLIHQVATNGGVGVLYKVSVSAVE